MPGPRRPRRDAEANRERLLAAAASAMLREGRHVPLATIAADAGVGIGTLYRSYQDRDALLRALEHRAYELLNEILDDLENQGRSGVAAIEEFLTATCDISDRLFLPLHGAPPLVTPEAVRARRSINQRLDAFIATARNEGVLRAPVNATDVITFSALITQPLEHGPDWKHMVRRQIAIFLNGLTTEGPFEVTGPPIQATDVEDTFQRRS